MSSTPPTVLVSTHRLPVAGGLRDAFRAEGFHVDLLPSPEFAEGRSDVALVVLTGERDGEGGGWAALARDHLGVPLFTLLPGADGVRRGRDLGALEAFPGGVSADEVALVGRRTVDRRRLQALTGIVGESDPVREVLERVVQIAPVDSTVLITGESGTGKELVARGIHALSPRRHRPFIAVNVAALSDTLLESELFGHEKGAFTGAVDARKGYFELANRGTLFLDEIGEMPLQTQTKFLRVLEQREFMRVGGEEPIRVDVRIVAATNRDLRDAVLRGQFRRDLFYRLNILDLRLPPLRERRDDIPLLVHHFVREVSQRVERPFPGIRPDALAVLAEHTWPGNIRELRNLVEGMVVLSPGRPIEPRDLPAEVRGEPVRVLHPPLGLLPPPAGGDPLRTPGELSPNALERSAREGHELEGSDGGARALRPELEFVFRTLVELRVDLEELRRAFERYQSASGWDEGGWETSTGWTPPTEPPRPRGREIQVPLRDAEPSAQPVPRASSDPSPPLEAVAADPAPFVLPEGMTMDELEEMAVRQALEAVGGNRRLAAERLGIGERTLYRKIQRFGLE
jgi:DNA-binding NtrC family response regulator